MSFLNKIFGFVGRIGKLSPKVHLVLVVLSIEVSKLCFSEGFLSELFDIIMINHFWTPSTENIALPLSLFLNTIAKNAKHFLVISGSSSVSLKSFWVTCSSKDKSSILWRQSFCCLQKGITSYIRSIFQNIFCLTGTYIINTILIMMTCGNTNNYHSENCFAIWSSQKYLFFCCSEVSKHHALFPKL